MPPCLSTWAMFTPLCIKQTRHAKRGASPSHWNLIRPSKGNWAKVPRQTGPTRMTHRFKKHYSREEARDLLPSVRKWLKQLRELRAWLRDCDAEFEKSLSQGSDLGGEKVNNWIKRLCQLQRLAGEFESREIQL